VGQVEFAARGAGRGGGELVAQGVEMVDRCGVGHAVILGDGDGLGVEGLFRDCPAGRAHFAWGDHFVVGVPCLAGGELHGASRWSADA